jgi:hypothetical protein
MHYSMHLLIRTFNLGENIIHIFFNFFIHHQLLSKIKINMVSSHSYSNNGLMKDKEMLEIIEQELKKSSVAGSVWQVVSADWFNKWKSLVEFSGNQSSELSEVIFQIACF